MIDRKLIPGNLVRDLSSEPQQGQAYLITASGMGTKAIATMRSKDAKKNSLAGTTSVSSMGVTFTQRALSTATLNLGVNAHKLVSVASSTFLYFNGDKGEILASDLITKIPLYEYAKRIGYAVEERPTQTEEEARKERRRAKSALDAAVREINKSLESLYAGTLTWKEKVKGKQKDYLNVPIIGTHGIKDGYICIAFDPVYASYLTAVPETHYASSLLGIPARQPNAYNIGLKLTEHYCIYENHTKGTHDRLSVKSLLAATDLPSYEEVKKKRKSWIERIKEPFQAALDTLVTGNVISDWHYVLPGGKEISDDDREELDKLQDYENWRNILVRFTLVDPPDLSEQIKTYTEKKKQAITRKKRIMEKAEVKAEAKKILEEKP